MEVIYSICGIDCANCALQLEKLNKIIGIENVKINFLAKKLYLNLEDLSAAEKVLETCQNFENGIVLKGLNNYE